jgi:multiple sugar transport system permease protein
LLSTLTGKKNITIVKKVFTYLALFTWLVITFFPIWWLIVTSIKLPVSVAEGATYLPWVDFKPSLHSWKYLLVDYWSELSIPYFNTLKFGLASALCALVIGSMGAYGLVRFEYGWKHYKNKDFAFLIISQRMLPPVAIVIPFLIMFKYARLIDTTAGMILVYTAFNIPFVVWMMKDFFNGIPREFEEAGLLDANRLKVFIRVILPLAAPGLVATFLFCLIFVWNEYLFALILTFSKATTMPILIAGQDTARGPQWWYISSLSVFTILPVIIIGLFIERYLVKGLTRGGIK